MIEDRMIASIVMTPAVQDVNTCKRTFVREFAVTHFVLIAIIEAVLALEAHSQ